MKYFSVFAFLFLLQISLHAQNFITAKGDFMDSAQVFNPKCDVFTPYTYYYNVQGKYPLSSDTLARKSQAFLESRKKNYSGNGYITFRCGIDCEGKRHSRVEVLQTDAQYKKYYFSKELVNELYTYFKTLDQWKPAQYKDSQRDSTYYLNYIAYITFKIQNGKVTHILP